MSGSGKRETAAIEQVAEYFGAIRERGDGDVARWLSEA